MNRKNIQIIPSIPSIYGGINLSLYNYVCRYV